MVVYIVFSKLTGNIMGVYRLKKDADKWNDASKDKHYSVLVFEVID